jgi:hypothetical protein
MAFLKTLCVAFRTRARGEPCDMQRYKMRSDSLPVYPNAGKSVGEPPGGMQE